MFNDKKQQLKARNNNCKDEKQQHESKKNSMKTRSSVKAISNADKTK
jgi:hypothetical protein